MVGTVRLKLRGKRGQTVTTCVSSNGTTCATNNSWQNGWIVFTDVNNDATVDPGDTILRVQSGFAASDTFIASNNVSFVSFNREGFASGLANGTLITLHAPIPTQASTRCLSLTLVGLMAVKTYGGTCL